MKPFFVLVMICLLGATPGCGKPGETSGSNDREQKKAAESTPQKPAVRDTVFGKGDYSILDTKLDEPDFLDLDDGQVAAIADFLAKKPEKSFANLHNLAVISFIKTYQYDESKRAEHRRDLARMNPDYRYGTMGFLADLPLGISGDCYGGGFSEGPPHVQIMKDGTLKGQVETNATIEDYSGTWEIRDGMLVISFTVAVEDTGDTGPQGKVRQYSFSDQKGFIIDRQRIFSQQGKICRLHHLAKNN